MTADIGLKADISSEIKRTYRFPGNEYVILNNPVELVVRPSGNHRVTTKDNRLHIIPSGWIHVEIESTTSWVV